jgi:hypothetical protein
VEMIIHGKADAHPRCMFTSGEERKCGCCQPVQLSALYGLVIQIPLPSQLKYCEGKP